MKKLNRSVSPFRSRPACLVLGLLLGLGSSLTLAASPDRQAPAAPGKAELRCGWYENPTPANVTLTDRHGTWTIATQGGHQAEGDWPQFSDSRWVTTNQHYGYGCACLKVIVDAEKKQVQRIVSAHSRPLAVCRKDRALKEPKP